MSWLISHMASVKVDDAGPFTPIDEIKHKDREGGEGGRVMGLDVSHDAFHGAYSAFNRLRQAVAKATGGVFPPHDRADIPPDYLQLGEGYDNESHPGLWEFLKHSDCDGEIDPATCLRVADDLEALLPRIAEVEADEPSTGHLQAAGGYVEVTKRFIAGCRAAAAAGEPLEFA